MNYFCDSNGYKIIPNQNYLDFTAPKEPESYIKLFYKKLQKNFAIKLKMEMVILIKIIQKLKLFYKMTREKRDIIRNCSGVRILIENIKFFKNR